MTALTTRQLQLFGSERVAVFVVDFLLMSDDVHHAFVRFAIKSAPFSAALLFEIVIIARHEGGLLVSLHLCFIRKLKKTFYK